MDAGFELFIPSSPLTSIARMVALADDWTSNTFPVPPVFGRIITPL
jgi:hypothetical protein